MNPYFSIIIVSLNAGVSLRKTVDSVLEQTFLDYEIIIKDACSTDGSVDMVKDNNQIKKIVCKDNGLYHAMNQAIPYATGRYILFLNCGDYLWDKYVLDKVYAFSKELSTPCVVYGNAYYDNLQKNRTPPEVITDYFWSVSNICHQACFFSIDSLEGEKTYDLTYRIAADNELMLKLFKKKSAFKKINMTVCRYEGGGYSETPKGKKIGSMEHKRMMKQYFKGVERLLFFLHHVRDYAYNKLKANRGK